MTKRVLVVGASPNPLRYSYRAVNKLIAYNHDVIAFGIKTGMIGAVQITTVLPEILDFHTVTLYVGVQNQAFLFNYFSDFRPNRVIFNPGTMNVNLSAFLEKYDIEVVEDCTLMMLDGNRF